MKKLVHTLCSLLAGFIILRFAALVWQYAVNLPIWDDFDSALLFANRFHDTPSTLERIQLVLEQHNEHRILINKVLTLLSIAIFSSVNFSFLIYCAVAALVALAVLLSAGTRERPYVLVITTAIMLQPQYGDGLNWVTTCLASFTLCWLALLCGRLAFTEGKSFYALFPTLAIAGFSQGNGILLPFCVVAVLLLQKRWRRAGGVFFAGVAIIALYFQGYHFPAQGNSVAMLLEKYPLVFEYGFSLIGASLGFSNPLATLWCGVVITVITLGFCFSPAARKHPAIVVFILFLFLSAAINTAARGLSGAQYTLSPGRYTILSSGILAGLAVLIAESITTVKTRALLLGAALAFNYASWSSYKQSIIDLHIRAMNDLALYLLFSNQGLTYPWPDRGVPIFEQSIAYGTLKPIPALLDDFDLATVASLPQPPLTPKKGDLRTHVDRVQAGKDYFVIEGWAFFRYCPSSATTVYLHLFNETSELVIKPRRKERSDISELTNNLDRRASGYLSIIPKSLLPSDAPYELEVALFCNGTGARQATQYRVSKASIEKLEKEQASK